MAQTKALDLPIPGQQCCAFVCSCGPHTYVTNQNVQEIIKRKSLLQMLLLKCVNKRFYAFAIVILSIQSVLINCVGVRPD
jgi:hypothetical protein